MAQIFRDRLRAWRGIQVPPLTQADLAARLGVTQPVVSDWERGVSLPSLALAHLLADIMGVRVDDLGLRSQLTLPTRRAS